MLSIRTPDDMASRSLAAETHNLGVQSLQWVSGQVGKVVLLHLPLSITVITVVDCP